MADDQWEWKVGIARWKQVHAEIRRQIRDGELVVDDRVPSVVQLQERYGIAIATAQKVIVGLRNDGLVRTEPGMGSYVLAGAAEKIRAEEAE